MEERKVFEVKIAGFNEDDVLEIDQGNNYQCGDIKNGICARFRGTSGGFVIDEKSLREALDKIAELNSPAVSDAKEMG